VRLLALRFAYLRFWEACSVCALRGNNPLKTRFRFRAGALGGVKSALTFTGFIPDSSCAAKMGTLGKRWLGKGNVLVRKEEPI